MEQELLYFLNYGVAGLMLFWFMFRMEKLIKGNTEALYALREMVLQLKDGK